MNIRKALRIQIEHIHNKTTINAIFILGTKEISFYIEYKRYTYAV